MYSFIWKSRVSEREKSFRERESFPSPSLFPKWPQWPELGQLEAKRQEFPLGVPSGSRDSSPCGPLFTNFQGTLPGSCTRSGAARTRTNAHIGCRHWEWRLHHRLKSTSLKAFFFWYELRGCVVRYIIQFQNFQWAWKSTPKKWNQIFIKARPRSEVGGGHDNINL